MTMESVLNREMFFGDGREAEYQRLQREVTWLTSSIKWSPDDIAMQEDLAWQTKRLHDLERLLGFRN
jgi:hypothetical protein